MKHRQVLNRFAEMDCSKDAESDKKSQWSALYRCHLGESNLPETIVYVSNGLTRPMSYDCEETIRDYRDGATIFVSTHLLNEAMRCDRISLMRARFAQVILFRGAGLDVVRPYDAAIAGIRAVLF